MSILTKAKQLSKPLLGLHTRFTGAAGHQLAEPRTGGLTTMLGQLPNRVVGGIKRGSTSRDEMAAVSTGTQQPWRRGLSEQEPEDALPGRNQRAVEVADESQVPEEVAKALEGLASPLEGEAALADGAPQAMPQDSASAPAKKEVSSTMNTDLRDLFAADEEVNEEFARLLKVLEDVKVNDLALQASEVTALIGQRKRH